MNPQHTIPTVIDDGFILTESRAILMYLANKYGANEESLYPTDPEKRALVDMRLCFDLATLYVRMSETFVSLSEFIIFVKPASIILFSFVPSVSSHLHETTHGRCKGRQIERGFGVRGEFSYSGRLHCWKWVDHRRLFNGRHSKHHRCMWVWSFELSWNQCLPRKMRWKHERLGGNKYGWGKHVRWVIQSRKCRCWSLERTLSIERYQVEMLVALSWNSFCMFENLTTHI